MAEFRISAELHQSLRAVREEVRTTFEQLRLRGESGDVSGKERLERVPALAKRNFGNLMHRDPVLAAKEAWRLVDFLEGAPGARLTPLAREALRAVELDAQLAKLRASLRWREASFHLREALGAPQQAEERIQPPPHDRVPPDRAAQMPVEQHPTGGAPGDAALHENAQGGVRTPRRRMLRRWLPILIVLLFVSGGVALLVAMRQQNPASRSRNDCVALEKASPAELADRWTVDEDMPAPLPPPDPASPDPAMFVIGDPPDGGPIRSIFTTSQFSYDERSLKDLEGGGKADFRLRVGGWADTYLSLLKFPLPNHRSARRALIRLTVLGDEPSSRPTPMALRAIAEPWDIPSGSKQRLWWADCPRSQIHRVNLPEPGAPESHYDIDITHIYNGWVRGRAVNHGIMLEPHRIGSYGASSERFPNFSTFYSTRAVDPDKRPKLILLY